MVKQMEQTAKQLTPETTAKCVNALKPLNMVTTKHLVALFGYNDGGKYLRRHLRKRFNTVHAWGDAWTWKPDDSQLHEIVEYFVGNGVFSESKRLTTKSLNDVHELEKIKF